MRCCIASVGDWKTPETWQQSHRVEEFLFHDFILVGLGLAVPLYAVLSATLCCYGASSAPGASLIFMKAILVETPGGPEQLKLMEIPTPTPAAGQALVKVAYSGVNFIDIYFRSGLYKADPPFSLGMEAAGVVEAIGEGVTEVAVGDRVAYAMCRGSYAGYAIVPSWQLVKVPAKLALDQAAAAMFQGMTAHYLTHSTWPLKQHETCLVHAAAGGWSGVFASSRACR